jgi:hypothetical protein
MIFRIKIRIFLWSIFGLGLLFLAYEKTVPFGHISYMTDFKHYNYFIGKLTPKERIESDGSITRIIGDPVYFSVYSPRNFNRATLTFEYKRFGNGQVKIPIIEAGILADKKVWRYDLEPVEN